MSSRRQVLDFDTVSTPRRRLMFDHAPDATDELVRLPSFMSTNLQRSITSAEGLDLSLAGKLAGTLNTRSVYLSVTSL